MTYQVAPGSALLNIISPRSTPEMAGLKGAFIDWLDILPHEHKARAWQMIDSFALHWHDTHTVAAHYRFAFPEDVVVAARIFERYLKSMPLGTVDAELQLLRCLRPAGILQLPVLTTTSPPLEDMLRSQTRKYERIFRGFDHQQAIKEEYDMLNDKKKAAAVPDCNDFPDNIEDQHGLVEELFDAILDFSAVEEQPRLLVKKSKKRKSSELEDEHSGNEAREWVDNTHVKRIKLAKDIEVQFLAWNLLRRTRDAQSGLVGIGPWATNWKYNRFGSFRERFDHVKEVCRRSKAVVVSMMTADDIFTRRLAAGPAKEIGQKRQNKMTNLQRDKQNKAALHCQAKGWVTKDDKGRYFDMDGALIVPSPPHRPRTETSEPIVEPANQLPGQQMWPAVTACLPGPSTMSVPTATNENYSPGSDGAVYPGATYENQKQLGFPAECMNLSQMETRPWGPGAGQHEAPHLDTKQEAADEDNQWYHAASQFRIGQ